MCVFSRQTICGKRREKKERGEEGLKGRDVGGAREVKRAREMKVASVTSQRKYLT